MNYFRPRSILALAGGFLLPGVIARSIFRGGEDDSRPFVAGDWVVVTKDFLPLLKRGELGHVVDATNKRGERVPGLLLDVMLAGDQGDAPRQSRVTFDDQDDAHEHLKLGLPFAGGERVVVRQDAAGDLESLRGKLGTVTYGEDLGGLDGSVTVKVDDGRDVWRVELWGQAEAKRGLDLV